MILDAAVLFVQAELRQDELLDVAAQAFTDDEEPEYLAILKSSSAAPPSVRENFAQFTTLSLWGDEDAGLREFAIDLSRRLDLTVLAMTMAGNACVGGWQVFRGGKATRSFFLENDPDNYAECGPEGFEAAFGVQLNPAPLERVHFLDPFMRAEEGICVRSKSPLLAPQQSIAAPMIRKIVENQVPRARFECMLLYDLDE